MKNENITNFGKCNVEKDSNVCEFCEKYDETLLAIRGAKFAGHVKRVFLKNIESALQSCFVTLYNREEDESLDFWEHWCDEYSYFQEVAKYSSIKEYDFITEYESLREFHLDCIRVNIRGLERAYYKACKDLWYRNRQVEKILNILSKIIHNEMLMGDIYGNREDS